MHIWILYLFRQHEILNICNACNSLINITINRFNCYLKSLSFFGRKLSYFTRHVIYDKRNARYITISSYETTLMSRTCHIKSHFYIIFIQKSVHRCGFEVFYIFTHTHVQSIVKKVRLLIINSSVKQKLATSSSWLLCCVKSSFVTFDITFIIYLMIIYAIQRWHHCRHHH